MRNTYTTAARAAHAPGDDTLARALKEALNSRALRARPSGHKCIDPARLRAGEAIPADACWFPLRWRGIVCIPRVL